MATLRILVLSDLHCHRFDRERTESFLLAGANRSPAHSHPVESLLTRFERTGDIAADVLLCPGDLADRVCQIGFQHAWLLVREIASRLAIPVVIATLGNHDVDSRRQVKESEPFALGRWSDPTFPLRDADARTSFFGAGFCSSRIGSVEILVLNTVVDHIDEETAKRGTFSEARVAALVAYLQSSPRPEHRIALLHHHAALHSSPSLRDRDVLETGDAILEALATHGFDVVIHGHKHYPRLRYVSTAAGRLPLFAAGSFSAYLQELATNTRNVCHLLDLDLGTKPLRGRLTTWQWRKGIAWVPATVDGCDFPYQTGFGAARLPGEIFDDLSKLLAPGPMTVPPQDLLTAAPDLLFLTPDEQSVVSQKVEAAGFRIEWKGQDTALWKVF